MPLHLPDPTEVPVPGGKSIREYVGGASTADSGVSVAVMRAPSGWAEPHQAPDFDEVTLVLDGVVRVESAEGTLDVAAGEAVLTRAGERVRYSCPEPAHYVAICVPAFRPDLVHREG